MKSFEEYLKRKRSMNIEEYPIQFDASDLALQFVPYFESGQRIEVQFSWEKMRGYVGVTTGWKPSFLLLSRCNSRSSSILLGSTDIILKVIPGKFRK